MTKNTTLAVGLTGLVATVASPYGLGVWRYAIGISTNERILGHIQEWAATTIRSPDGAVFFISALAIVVFLARRWNEDRSGSPSPGWGRSSSLASARLAVRCGGGSCSP